MTDPLGIVALDRIAVLETSRLVDAATAEDWARPTPCAGWDLRRLVAHMTAQHRGFAAAARGAGADPAYWREQEERGEPSRIHREAVTALLAAFAANGVQEREFVLPELGLALPGSRAIGFHFIDHVVHAWDVAVSLGLAVQLPEPVLEAGLVIARLVPDDPAGRGPGRPFAQALAVPAGAGPLDETLRLLGRTPEEWPAAA
ncbi:TIGR03086 family protein [Streptomyces dioscori]|uniref:TIGR03086 family protein n=1 Tax=Streptomyces dioscori TaxID=2109333 RepID=A0A2P8PU39_9ACTN|nr:TIGR03086 family metal-binding protein [Streptomyces dioscori]PSM37521.1 TIGR03086 family protein [Streptomyces dioscori]